MSHGISQLENRNWDFKKQITARQGVAGVGVQVIRDSEIWYVDSGKANAVSGNGKTWDDAFYTIEEAITAAGDDDIIYLAPGDYVIAEALEITQNGLTIIGANRSCNDYKTLIYTSDAVNAFEVDANHVSIIGVGISMVGGAGAGVKLAGTTASYKFYLGGCRLDGWSAGTYGVQCDSTQDQPDLTIEGCLFRSWQTAAILANATRIMIKDNYFFVTTDKIGIQYVPNGTTRPDGIIDGNRFCGLANATTTAIAMTGTPTAGDLIMVDNKLAGTWDVTIEAEANGAGVENYEGSTTGGSVIDCNSNT